MKAEFVLQENGVAVVRVHLGVYPHQALLKAAHKVTGRCFVHLEPELENAIICRLKPKQPMQNILVLAGEFCNEILDQTLRESLEQATAPVRTLLLAQAFSRTNLLHPELDGAPGHHDPLNIAVPDLPR